MRTRNGVTIVRAGNGWIVESYDISNDTTERLVFNDMGYASGTNEKTGDQTLLGWIEKHMALPQGAE